MLPDPSDTSIYPSTRYQGSKRKLVPWLYTIFSDLEFDSAMDLMSGSSTVGYLLKAMGKRVTVNDYLKFNYHTGIAFIENKEILLTEDDLSWITSKHRNVKYSNFIESNFNGLYFKKSENIWLDVVLSNIFSPLFPAKNKKYKRSLALHAVSQAALMKRPFNLFHRANLYIRTANVDRQFGNKTTWDRHFNILFRKIALEANAKVFCNGQHNSAMNKDALDVEASNSELVYIDPPYFYINGSQKKTNYHHLYHFLEGMAQYNNWNKLIDEQSKLKALRRDNSSLSAFYSCPTKELQIGLTRWFGEIFEKWSNSILVFSYKQPGLPNPEEIRKSLQKCGKRVKMRKKPYSYALHHQNGSPKHNIEIVLIAE